MKKLTRKSFGVNVESCSSALDLAAASDQDLLKRRPNLTMDFTTKIEEQILFKTLPDVVWKRVFANLLCDSKTLRACSQVSGFFDEFVQRNEHLSIVSRGGDYRGSFGCVPKSTVFSLFPEPILAKPKISVIKICLSPNFQPINDYLEWLIDSQSDSLQILQISSLGNVTKPFGLVLSMDRLRVLKIERTLKHRADDFFPSITFPDELFFPALESLTLSAFGHDRWRDLLRKPPYRPHHEYPTCESVKHLCLLPARPAHLRWTTRQIGDEFQFPNLVSLEIPAMLLDHISKIFREKGNLKRLVLTLPTRGLQKHLFDMAITGYGKQLCAAILENPDRDPQDIRSEIEEETERQLDDFDGWERERIMADNEFRRKGCRFLNLTDFAGLEELQMKSDTGKWGPTLVSCQDLLSMKSLKILGFSGFNPKYIPENMMRKLRERFTVQTPNSTYTMNSNHKIKPKKQSLLEIEPEAGWKQVFGCLGSSFHPVESYPKPSEVFNVLAEHSGLLAFKNSQDDQNLASKFRNGIALQRGVPLQPIPRITTLDICIKSLNFQPMGYHLNSLLKSQRDSLEILHISCLGKEWKPINVDLPEGMKKLRDLKLVRNMRWDERKGFNGSLHFRETAFLPALKSLSLSSGCMEGWQDFLHKPDKRNDPNHPTCQTVKHLRLLPARAADIQRTLNKLTREIVFPNLVTLEIPAVVLDIDIEDIFPTPQSLKRLTLTLPTRPLHKHLFDMAITGFGEQVCAAIFDNPDRDPQQIRAEIEEENERQLDEERVGREYVFEKARIKWDNQIRRLGRRWPNVTQFLGLEELRIKSDTGKWGPTLVSCPDLLRMESLKTLQFLGHQPKYIPDEMLNKMRERFTVLVG